MPIYEYHCAKCGEEFEKLILGDTESISCPECQGTEVRKLMSACAFSVGSTFKSTASSSCGSCKPASTACSACSVKH
ncbi:MAG: zinc ribbon domain-containing protein [Proteobacteria bacterium]|nr:zinc ribbon domain-containing protein [Pseudomonadota bacterium]NIS70847.1 zinc ribbon domain-containing protein [Pseudomonadota bacterium]